MKYELDVTKLSYESKRVLAFDKNTPSGMLDALADDEEVDVRMNVASNSNTSVKTLMKLSDDKDSDVKEMVAFNENTPVEILERYADSESANVKYMVASNRSIPIYILEKLAVDNNDDIVFEGVAYSKNVTPDILIILRKSKDIHVQLAIIKNSKTPLDIIEAFTKSDNIYIRVAAKTVRNLRHEITLKNKQHKCERT